LKKKKIDAKQTLLLFISIHLLIIWVIEREDRKTEQLFLYPSTNTAGILSKTKNSKRQDLSIKNNENLYVPILSLQGQ
jgi:hypothetical protein